MGSIGYGYLDKEQIDTSFKRIVLLRKSFFLRIIGIIIISVILTRIDIASTVNKFAGIHIYYFVIAILIFPFLILIKSWRWQVILEMQDIKANLKDLYLPYMASFSAGVITPGRLGEFAKVLYLKEMGYPLGKSIFNTVLDRLMDILFMMIIACIGLLIIFQSTYFRTTFFVALMLVSLLTLWMMKNFRNNQFFTKVINKRLIFLLPQMVLEKIKPHLDVIKDEFCCIKLSMLSYAGIITILSWLFYYFQIYLLILSLQINLSLLNTAIFVTISSLLGLIPITFLGVGTRDASLIYLFNLQGLSGESAVAFSTLILTLILINAVTGSVAFMRLAPTKKMRVKGINAVVKEK